MKVVVITGASRGIGSGLASAFRETRYAVVATSRSIPASDEPDYLTARSTVMPWAMWPVTA